MKKILLSILMLALPMLAIAYDCQIDGIYYNLNREINVAEVTCESSSYNSYSGDVVIPEKFNYEGLDYSVTSIGNYAFAYSSTLTSVTIPNSVTTIGERAFRDCKGLTSVTIPNIVTAIGAWAFYGCSGLISMTIPNTVTTIEKYSFYGCSCLTFVTIPNSVISIGEKAFRDCTGITSLTIPNSVAIIERYAFLGCSGLTTVTIGNSVRSIGSQAFAECSKLEEVFCLAEKVPETNSDSFAYSNHKNAILYVPEASMEDYKSTAPWSEFMTLLPLPDETGIENATRQKAEVTDRYTLDGIKGIGTKKGLNIIRMSDGTTKKVIVK